MVEIPILRFKPAEPVNTVEVLETQVRRLIEVGIPKEVGVVGAKFLDDVYAHPSFGSVSRGSIRDS